MSPCGVHFRSLTEGITTTGAKGRAMTTSRGGLYSTGTRPTIRTHTCRSVFGRQEGPAPGPSGGHPAHRSGNPGEEVPTGGTGPGKLPSWWASVSRQMLDETLEGLDALFKKNGGTPVGVEAISHNVLTIQGESNRESSELFVASSRLTVAHNIEAIK